MQQTASYNVETVQVPSRLAGINCQRCCMLEYSGLKEPRVPFVENENQVYTLDEGAGGKAWTQ